MSQDTNTQTTPIRQFDLVATAAHELKTPLSLIAGLSSMLRRGEIGAVDKAQTRYLEKIEYSSDRLLRLTEGIIRLNQAQRGVVKASPVAIKLPKLIKDIQAEFMVQCQQHQQKINLKVTKGIPLLMADYQAVYQIFFNVIDNALRYSPPGSTVSIAIKTKGADVVAEVRDRGIGIRGSELTKIFERFGRSQQPLTQYAGSTGLGLFIVKNLLEEQGGSIRVRPRANGSSFIITLPAVEQLTLF